jgi:hypothetical protein
MNHQLHCLALKLLVVSLLYLLFFHGLSHFAFSFRVRQIRGGSIHTSWEALRSQLSTHQVVTVRLPTIDGRAFTIRRDARPEQIHRDIYRVLRVPERILSPIMRWTQNSH